MRIYLVYAHVHIIFIFPNFTAVFISVAKEQKRKMSQRDREKKKKQESLFPKVTVTNLAGNLSRSIVPWRALKFSGNFLSILLGNFIFSSFFSRLLSLGLVEFVVISLFFFFCNWIINHNLPTFLKNVGHPKDSA